MNDHVSLRLQLSEFVNGPVSLLDDRCSPAVPTLVQDLVENPVRSLETEFKSWRNLDNPEDQSELARDIAAIANTGGGHIVFGFHEDSLEPTDTHPFVTHCSAEKVTRIVSAYLEPGPVTEVSTVRSGRGDLHPVVRIDAHGAVPVCARRAGPLIERAAVYIRRYRAQRDLRPPQAETARAETAQDWAPLIRRCARFDREALLCQMEALLAQQPVPLDLRQVLLNWHSAARAAFLGLVPRSPHALRIEQRHHAFSYLIAPQTHLLEPAQLPEFLRRCAFDAQTRFGQGLRMFEPPYRAGARPRFVADPACGDPDTDFLETAWLRAHPVPANADFWRISPRGIASLVRDYIEDRPDAVGAEQGEMWLSPVTLARDLAELLWHARALSRFFPSPARVLVRCDWWGLAGRRLNDTNPTWACTPPAIGDHRAAWLDLDLAGFANYWPEAVARLMAPVVRAFDPELTLDADWVRAHARAVPA